jgi:ABC-type sugar transport system permease subunit
MEGSNLKIYNLTKKRKLEGFLFAIPWIIGFIIFWMFPLLSSLYLSFTESSVNQFFGGKFLKFDNYLAVISDVDFGRDFVGTLMNSLINIPIIIIFSIFAASLLNQNLKGRWFFRAVFFMPVILAGAVMSVLLNLGLGDAGLGSRLVGQMNFLKQLLGEDLISRLGVIIWQSSVQILIFLAGLQSIPKSIYEASQIDGASPWECFWKITIPYIFPIIILNIIYSVIDSFTDPMNKIIEMIKISIFQKYDFGFASALSWLYFVIIFVFVLMVMGIGALSTRQNRKEGR